MTETKHVNPWIIAVSVMFATFMEVLDTTVVNVSLPHIAGTLSATIAEATWALTSYLVANAIILPMTGWLASMFGRKNLLMFSVVGFTAASFLCGLAPTLGSLIVFRIIQGATGGALQPLSQAVLLEAFPPHERGKAMGFWGLGIVVAPMLGPILGGWLTDNYSWRWVFYINVPLGILAFLGVAAYMPDGKTRRSRFDFFGFALLSIAVAGLQLVLDRGPIKDWFGSNEIWIEATAAGLAFYLFMVHSATSPHPFIRPSLLKDRNFLTGNIFIFVIGIVLFATLALLPPLLQNLLNYPVYTAGLLTAPRSVGTMVAMLFVGRVVGRLDARLIIGSGFLLAALSLWQMTHFDLLMSGSP